MKLDLILKDITDPKLRENFYRIQRFTTLQALLLVDFTFFEVTIQTGPAQAVAHGLGYIPKDILVTSALGNLNYYFNTNLFDKTNIYVTAAGPVTLRFFAGTYPSPVNPNVKQNLTFTPPT